MPKTRPFRKLSIDENLCLALLKQKASERRYGSLTEFVSELLDWYVQGLLVRGEMAGGREQGLITAARVEPTKAINERAKTG